MADKGDGVAAGTVFGNVPEVQAEIMGAVLRERASQDAKFGTQDHPDVDPSFAAPGRVGGRLAMTWISERLGLPSADVARVRRIAARESGSLSGFHVLAEWTAEACEAATAVCDRIVAELRRSLDYFISQPYGMAVDTIVLSGAGAMLSRTGRATSAPSVLNDHAW